MRITNKMMQNNSLTNLNNNKILQDRLNNQIASEKKISRPSDDPVIAIRALRLRTNLSEIDQYLEKNVEDAENWISSTEAALDNMNSVLTDMYSQCETGNNGGFTSENRAAVLEQLKGLRDEVYSTGDSDCAGRTLFTGYRTDSKLKFQDNTVEPYQITEKFTKSDMDSKTYVNTQNLKDITATSIPSTAITENSINDSSVNRIMLSYGNLDDTSGLEMKLSKAVTTSVSPSGNTVTVGTGADSVTVGISDAGTTVTSAGGGAVHVGAGNPLEISVGGVTYSVPYTDAGGGAVQFATEATSSETIPVTTMSSGGATDPYTAIATGSYKAILVPETGELLLSDATKDAINTLDDNDEISFTYRKENWVKDDLRPEHYFACVANPDAVDNSRQVYSGEAQYMEYDVGYNQKMRVNTLASEVFTHDIGRTVDELVQASQDVVDMEAIVKDLTAMVDNSDYDQDKVTSNLEAANKALTLLKDKEKKLYGKGMTAMQGYMAQTNLATTNLGNRDSRLALIKTRLTSQQTNFKGLVQENEGANVEAVSVELKSATVAYDAALMATSKIVQNSLMNYI